VAPTPEELRRRLGVDPVAVPDPILQQCLDVAFTMVNEYVPVENRGSPLYAAAVLTLGVRVYEEENTGRGGMDPGGEYDYSYLPGATARMVKAAWAYIGPITTVPVPFA